MTNIIPAICIVFSKSLLFLSSLISVFLSIGAYFNISWYSSLVISIAAGTKLSFYPLYCASAIVFASVKKWCQFTFISYYVKIPFRICWRV